MLIVISAPSGAGKTTLCARLLSSRPDLRLSISTTTRAPRGSEQNGKEYHFTDTASFETMIREDVFAEWARVHDKYYGTSKRTIEQAFRDGYHVLLDIDVQGAASLKKAYGPRCFTVFISPPDLETLETRLRSRGTDTEEVIQKRMRNARKEMDAAPTFDHVIINDDLERACEELNTLIAKKIPSPAGIKKG